MIDTRIEGIAALANSFYNKAFTIDDDAEQINQIERSLIRV
jgi:hypothetical protein